MKSNDRYFYKDPCYILNKIQSSPNPFPALTKGGEGEKMQNCTVISLETPGDFNTKILISLKDFTKTVTKLNLRLLDEQDDEFNQRIEWEIERIGILRKWN
jgi:hypothetical protein